MRVNLDEQATDVLWPPSPPVNEPRRCKQGSSFDLCVTCGDSHSTFSFSLFKYPASQTELKKNQVKQVPASTCILDRFSISLSMQSDLQPSNTDTDNMQEHSVVDVGEPTLQL